MMVKQDIIGPFDLDGTRYFSFYQNKSGERFSDGYSIRYFSKTLKERNGWVSLGTVKKPYIETAKQTVINNFEILTDEKDFVKYGKKNFRQNKSTTKLIMGNIERKVDYEWIPLINSFVDELYEKYSEDLTVKLEEQSKLIGDE